MMSTTSTLVTPTSASTSTMKHNAMEDDHSYDDVMALISQAKEVSASIDKTMKDMKHHFLLVEEEEEDKVVKTVHARYQPIA